MTTCVDCATPLHPVTLEPVEPVALVPLVLADADADVGAPAAPDEAVTEPHPASAALTASGLARISIAPAPVTATNAVPCCCLSVPSQFAASAAASGSIVKNVSAAWANAAASNPLRLCTTRCVGKINSPSESMFTNVIITAASGYAGSGR